MSHRFYANGHVGIHMPSHIHYVRHVYGACVWNRNGNIEADEHITHK